MKIFIFSSLLLFSTNTFAGMRGFYFMPLPEDASNTPINVALPVNGGVPSASSAYFNGNYPVSGLTNGNRTGSGWGARGGWNDNTINVFPDWVVITFNSVKTIKEINVFTSQSTETSTAQPTLSMSCGDKGIVDFEVQYWDSISSTWVTVPGGNVTGNDKVWRQFRSTISTDKIRVYVTATGTGGGGAYSRIMELEAWTETTP